MTGPATALVPTSAACAIRPARFSYLHKGSIPGHPPQPCSQWPVSHQPPSRTLSDLWLTDKV